LSNLIRFGLNYGKVSNKLTSELANGLNEQAERTNLKTLNNINKGDVFTFLD